MSSSQPIFYNAHHSPIGAFATLTFGCKGATGGFGLELKGPADESLYIGAEERDAPGKYRAFPFYGGADFSDASVADFDVEGHSDFKRQRTVFPFPDDEIERTLGAAVDEWVGRDLTFRIYSPVVPVPDPEKADPEELKAALVPALIAEMVLDNRLGKHPRKVFFGYAGSNRSAAMRSWMTDQGVGIGQGLSTAIASLDPDMYAGVAWQPEAVLEPTAPENLNFLLGSLGLLVGTVAPGEVRTFRFAIAFYRDGTATSGLPCRYLYRRWFDSIDSVLRYALENANHTIGTCVEFDRSWPGSLSHERKIMLAQAIRSYYGSTQCLERPGGAPFWVVNEGEYRMMNTFDLTVDQAFFELALNPWTVRNELDVYVERYSYVDRVRFPGECETHPGGIAFTHDMGIGNALSEPGCSGYEQSGLKGCFSYMSCEELLNWILTACVYAHQTGDWAWVRRRAKVFADCLRSLMARDDPRPDHRNGLMGLDSDRCAGGYEITTYDSLDASLGQARNNLYLGVKSWAAYVLLEPVLRRLGEEKLARAAADQAKRCASTIVSSAGPDGLLPAVIGEGVEARIIPAIEGLVYPLMAGLVSLVTLEGPFGSLRAALEKHFDGVLKPGICLFDDGGWRLSSTSRNSWLSKIYLCQFIAERVFGRSADGFADRAHLSWLMAEDNAYYAWSDQMLEGTAVGSRYYPRGVTAILWLAHQGDNPIAEVRDVLRGKRDVWEPVAS